MHLPLVVGVLCISILVQPVRMLARDSACGDQLELNIGDIFRISYDPDRDNEECTRTFKVSNGTQVVLECSDFDIGNGNSFETPTTYLKDKHSFSGKSMDERVTGIIPVAGQEKGFEMDIKVKVPAPQEFVSLACVIKGQELDRENNIEPLVPKCHEDDPRVYVVKPKNEFTVHSDRMRCPINFFLNDGVSASIRCTTFQMGRGIVLKSRFTSSNDPDVEPDDVDFGGNMLHGKIFGYLPGFTTSTEEGTEATEGIYRRWVLEIESGSYDNLDGAFDCIVTGE